MHKFMKKKTTCIENLSTEEFLQKFKTVRFSRMTLVKGTAFVLAVTLFAAGMFSLNKLKAVGDENLDLVALAPSPAAATSGKKDVISIPSGVVKANPFLPYRNIGGTPVEVVEVNDVPKFALIEPPDVTGDNPDAARIMDTVVSGILYDKYSPSAILNIEGNDYLVKKGDVVNNYKVLAIAQDSVTVKLGKNTYKAGIGEILTEGTVNYNEISNINNKFGGKK